MKSKEGRASTKLWKQSKKGHEHDGSCLQCQNQWGRARISKPASLHRGSESLPDYIATDFLKRNKKNDVKRKKERQYAQHY
jgi:hypothetical protein